jgi:hypothetical protein
LGDHAGHLTGVRDVGGDADGTPPMLGQPGRLFSCRKIEIGGDHIGAFLGEQYGRRPTDTRARPGIRRPSFKSHPRLPGRGFLSI